MKFLFIIIVCIININGIDTNKGDECIAKIPGGSFLMGNSKDVKLIMQQLGPQQVSVDDFYIDKWAVTNKEFRDFVRDTKYQTDSEKYGWSFVLDYQATDRAKELSESQVKDATHWLAVPQSYWRAPNGPGSGIKEILDHPAGHLSYNDGVAYCKWRGMRLPTETEWEYAARGGLHEKRYPWGDKKEEKKMNIWQGKFPKENDLKDGFAITCPSKHFEPNGFGLYNTLGNVWEWTSTKFTDMNPNIPKQEQQEQEQRVLRGGSFLDSIDGSFNHPVDLNTRMPNTDDSASSNTGIRCAKSIGKKKHKGYKYPKKKKKGVVNGLDQEMLQKIAEEGGIEALQEALGDKATVTTPGKLKEQQQKLKEKLKEL